MFDKLIQYLVRRAGKEYSAGCRGLAAVLGAALFLGGWPLLLWIFGRWFHQAILPCAAANILGAVCFVVGIPEMLWAVLWQLWKGKGTPVPAIPTKNFLETGPYRYCRNPMVLGFFLYLAGWAILLNQAGAYLAAVALGLFLVAEIKLVEEKELEQRFGDAYREYKKETPFFIPRKKKNKGTAL